MRTPITIEYNNGDVATYVAAPPEWAKWELKNNKTILDAAQGLGIADLMFLAYNAYKRENAGKQVKPYEIWSETIANIEPAITDPKATSAEV